MSVEELFEKHRETTGVRDFGKVVPKRSLRADLHAFLLLDGLVPDSRDIVSAAEEDVIYLSVTCEGLEGVISEEQIIELVRCGVFLAGESGSLMMFV